MTAHCETAGRLEELLRTDLDRGLDPEEARRRLGETGPNELRGEKPPGRLRRLLGQLTDPMILVLFGAAGLSLWAGGGKDWLDSAIILVIIVVNALLSITQEDHAQKALEELRRMSAPTALVRRGGALERVAARELVPGDVVYMEAGDLVPADGRLLTGAGLRMDESAMTGESLPVDKAPGGPLAENTPLAERGNTVLAGTVAVAGRGSFLVTATGMDTEMGRIAGMLGEGRGRATPLQKRMGEISRTLSLVCLGVCALLFAIGLWQGKNFGEMFLTAVSLAVAAIPEGLPAIVTMVLALGVGRLARRGAIVRKLPAVETLGCAGVICSDKTGTLTRGRMEVTALWTPAPGGEGAALTAFALCNDAKLREGEPPLGDPTEAALLVRAEKAGLSRAALEGQYPRVGEWPFDAQRKRMTTLHRTPGGLVAYVKGAPDLLLARCDRVLTAQGEAPLTPALRRQVERQARTMGEGALRVLGAARRTLDKDPGGGSPERVERGLVFLGLAGMMDPPRPEAAEAVARCRRAGIRPVMITGDHKTTAAAIARQLDILRPGDGVMTGEELDFLTQGELEREVARVAVYARVTPEHKMRVVQALQAGGEVVAMTGDGVNDVPALCQADIGCAMGRGGTQVARSAAHLVLTDDNFATLVSAVAEGRGIYANIKKAIHYLLSCNMGEILTLLAATALNFGQMPLKPVQLLWLNLVTDSLPALALGVEPVEPGAMERPPRGAGERLFDGKFTFRLLWQGCMVGALTLGAYALGMLALPGGSGEMANTMAFATLTFCQLFHAFNVRSAGASLFELGLLSNKAMVRAFLLGAAMQCAVLLWPPAMGAFGTCPMTALGWMTVLSLAAAPIAVCEIVKMIAARGGKTGKNSTTI